jgi:hypothetical protein
MNNNTDIGFTGVEIDLIEQRLYTNSIVRAIGKAQSMRSRQLYLYSTPQSHNSFEYCKCCNSKQLNGESSSPISLTVNHRRLNISEFLGLLTPQFTTEEADWLYRMTQLARRRWPKHHQDKD